MKKGQLSTLQWGKFLQLATHREVPPSAQQVLQWSKVPWASCLIEFLHKGFWEGFDACCKPHSVSPLTF